MSSSSIEEEESMTYTNKNDNGNDNDNDNNYYDLFKKDEGGGGEEEEEENENVLDFVLSKLESIVNKVLAKTSSSSYYFSSNETKKIKKEIIILAVLILSFTIIAIKVITNKFLNQTNNFLGFGDPEERKRKLSARKGRDSIVLCGESSSGKTSCFLMLRSKSLGYGTVCSMKENECQCAVESSSTSHQTKEVNVIDIPGYGKIRKKFYGEFLQRAKAIVFFVDAVEFSTNRKDVADHLYNEILTDEGVRRNRVPILIACNKMDLAAASPASFIKKRLEQEIEMIRQTRDSILEDAKFDDGSRKARKRAKDAEKRRQREVVGLGWKEEWGKFSFDLLTQKKTHGSFKFSACSCKTENDIQQRIKSDADVDGGGNSSNSVSLSAVKEFVLL